MAQRYHYSHHGVEHGPLLGEEMQQRAAAGDILPTDLVWKAGTSVRIAASRVGQLFPEPPPSPPAAVPEPPASVIEPPARKPPPTVKPKERRVVSIKGATLVGQDGATCKFVKKCEKCGGEDPSRTTLPIRAGTMRVTFFCRKCRQARSVEIISVG